MKNHNFQLVNADTDSISFCKSNKEDFSIEEQQELLNELNSLFPENITFESEGVFQKVIVTKAKNYLLVDKNSKWYLKGAALKATTKEKRLRKLLKDMLKSMVQNENNLVDLYNEVIIEAMNLNKDNIINWASKKTITDKVLRPKRTNEQKIADVIKGKSYTMGDKIYVFFKSDNSLSLVEDFNGDYNKTTMLKKIWSTVQVFSTFLDTKNTFLNYSLKRNLKKLEELCQKHGQKFSL